MKSKSYQEEINLIKTTLISAAKELKHLKINNIMNKNIRDIVTDNDIYIEKFIINKIHTKYRDDVILSEELNHDVELKGRLWIIDPIDGTCNYANDIPMYGIQIALMEDNTIKASGIIIPNSNELYLAVKNEGCYLNENLVHINPKKLDYCIVSFGDYNPKLPHESELQSKVMHDVKYKIMKEKMYGAATIDYTYCLSGKIDGSFLIASCPWDYLPGLLMAEEAGMYVSSPLKSKNSNLVIIANNKELFELLKG